MKTLTMNDGRQIPTLGYGTYRLGDGVATMVADALATGYRHIDTAAVYDNEVGVGRGIAASGLARRDVFVTTKLWNADQANPAAALAASLERLGLEWVDLYLIHWPVPTLHRYVAAWEALIELREQGLAKSIGVSNFYAAVLDDLAPTGVVPAVNQVEKHPTYANRATVEANTSRGILTECYSPLGRARDLAEPVLGIIGARVGASPAQVVLAWHLARNHVVIPKTADPVRLRENFEAAEVRLTDNDLAAIDALDRGNRLGSDPASFVG